MAFVKTKLKAARDSLGKKDYISAKKEASLVLDYEPENYNAHVFLALAFLELGEYENSEQTYLKATGLNPKQPLAWQGISKLYEKREQWDKYAGSLLKLIDLFNNPQDAVKCAECLQKLVALRREQGSRSDLIFSLSYYLPTSHLYETLSSLPPPDLTNPTGTTTFEAQSAIHNNLPIFNEIVSLVEDSEEETFKKEVEKRRTRLGAGTPEEIRKEVFREISSSSKLPELYGEILNHPATPDDQRREIDAKLLRWKERYLRAIPNDKADLKTQVAKELDDMVEGIVLLNVADDLGWKLYFESQDLEQLAEYNKRHIKQFIGLFPESPTALLLKGLFAFLMEHLSDDPEEQALYAVEEEDPLDTILFVYGSVSDTILGGRIMSEVYLQQADYENSIKTSKATLQVLNNFEHDTGKYLTKTRTAIQAILGTSLVHFFPPKHHPTADTILEDVLKRSPQNTRALMSKGYILEAAQKWEEARGTFDTAARLSEDQPEGLRAREEAAWCGAQIDDAQAAISLLQDVLNALNDVEDDAYATDRARCLWRTGQLYIRLQGAENIAKAYKCYVTSLKHDPTFAPAFTALGIYYLEHASPSDPVRSSKCFQKAFELDARENIAARRLVEGFADDREWDLVEVVAQRTIEGEGGLTAGLDKKELDATTRYLPTNAWAWKATGVVKFHYKDYPASIQAFQVYLRVHPEDQPSWVQLGEAYDKAGRYAAAIKALNHAHELQPDDWICMYFIAEVKQTMGALQEAIDILKDICSKQPKEAAVLSLLAKVYFNLGTSEMSDAFKIRAEQSFVAAIQTSVDMIDQAPGCRTVAWKVIADSLHKLASFASFNDEGAIRASVRRVSFMPPPDIVEAIKVIPKCELRDGVPLTSSDVLSLAIYANLSQISLYSLGQTFMPSGWYDLAVSVQSWIARQLPTADVTSLKEAVIDCLKKAIKIEPGNAQYWVALGTAYFASAARAAQHAYIKALDIDNKNAATWVNLGLLYFHHGDTELANEVFYRAQVLDPDNTLAWIGQFLVATAKKDKRDATALLQHAVTLPSPVAEADYEFAVQQFSLLKPSKTKQNGGAKFDDILPAFFALHRYCQFKPSEPSGSHLLALICELLGHFDQSAKLVEQAISVLEAVYEETEDLEVEKRYTIANATLGRVKLAQGDFGASIDAFDSVLGLLGEKEDQTSRILKVQAFLGIGLSHFYQGNLQESLDSLQNGYMSAVDDDTLRGQLMIVSAQVLWAIGTEETKESAKSRLLECISSDPGNLAAINTLAGMGILTADDTLVDAALSEILTLPIDQKKALDPRGQVDYLLIQHCLAQGDISKGQSIAQHSVQANPHNLEGRNRLAALSMQKEETREALAIISGADTRPGVVNEIAIGYNDNNNTGGPLEAVLKALCIQAVAQCSSTSSEDEKERKEALRKAQRAIILHPSNDRGWQTLAYVRASTMEEKQYA